MVKAKLAKTKIAGIAERSDIWQEIVGRKMLRWKSTAKAKEKAKAMAKVRTLDMARVHGNPRDLRATEKAMGKRDCIGLISHPSQTVSMIQRGHFL